MKKADTGGAAFPGLHPSKECHYADAGMTLRDYFAAKAMEGFLACTTYSAVSNPEVFARNAYVVADAMLKVRGA